MNLNEQASPRAPFPHSAPWPNKSAGLYKADASSRSRHVFEMEFTERDGLCKVCYKVVSARQHALECDRCHRWVHRLCNTGITYVQYRRIMDNLWHGGTFPWICPPCEAETRPSIELPDDADGEVADDVEADSTHLVAEIGAATMESTRLDTVAK